MLKRDFIMVQIEEIGKAIALLFFYRKEGKGQDKNPTILSEAYLALKIDSPVPIATYARRNHRRVES